LRKNTTVIDATGGTHPASWPDTEMIVLISEWDVPMLIEMVEASAFAWRRPWFPVLLDHPYLRCGPVVVPSLTACHRCFLRRRRQHAKHQDFSLVPDNASVVRGYAGHHVTMAAGLALQAIPEALSPDGQAPGGWVRTVNLIDSSPGRAGVVAVDGCARCRAPRDPGARLADLAATLEGALQHG
jgi:bacteriocin biosynthesis cyclodehydratase domain-containing protein